MTFAALSWNWNLFRWHKLRSSKLEKNNSELKFCRDVVGTVMYWYSLYYVILACSATGACGNFWGFGQTCQQAADGRALCKCAVGSCTSDGSCGGFEDTSAQKVWSRTDLVNYLYIDIGWYMKFRSQTSDLWTDATTVVRAVREEKESEEKESVDRRSSCAKR